MSRNPLNTLAALVLLAAPLASSATTIKIDFEEFAYGASVGDYYNHGKDSYNRASGSYYGVTFNGGTIKATPRGAYLAGATTLTIDPNVVRALLGTDQYYITFNAGIYYQRDYREVRVTDTTGFTEPAAYVTGNSTPDCQPSNGCVNPYYGTMGAYDASGANGSPVQVVFPTDRLDNLVIRAVGDRTSLPTFINGTYELDRDIPEPASLALLGIGAAGLLARRRRRPGAAQR